MPKIHKLDPQLANQIAAGEVVERPASVVKELLENAIDAGATRIEVDIESGGTSLIRIKDNGVGIPKDELELALAPYATSKIENLSDLEAIASFGFRGEALASISSVSRLTLSSRPKEQDTGWQAEAQGRDMAVELLPAAVAEGTQVSVRDLFFNTPARRRFLRTEKTEFAHIDDVVRKAALANFHVALSLKHNGRSVRRLRAADSLEQREQRVASVLGRDFMLSTLHVELEHEGIRLSGWLGMPGYHRSQIDGQFFYVNHRPVRDKVLNHAIREAYQPYLPEGRVAAYVLYMEIDPREVDVNVHPTKHEVRFHNNRLVHDLLQQAISQTLNNEQSEARPAITRQTPELEVDALGNAGGYASYTGVRAGAQAGEHRLYTELLKSSNSNAGMSIESPGDTRKVSIPFLRLDADHMLGIEGSQLRLIDISRLREKRLDELRKDEVKKLLFPLRVDFESEHLTHLSECLSNLGYEIQREDGLIKILSGPRALDGSDGIIWCLELCLENASEVLRDPLLDKLRACTSGACHYWLSETEFDTLRTEVSVPSEQILGIAGERE